MPSNPNSELVVADAQDEARLQAQLDAGALIVDSGRRRPFYFDGRFLTADDLTADQDYIRGRQADLAQALGAGVIRGLGVALGTAAASNSPTLIVEPGIGLTPGGDIVQIAAAQTLDLASLPVSAQLDAQLGIKVLPGSPPQDGLFVLALRPIEYSANPIAAYPTTLDGQRTVRDGDIVEATAITLIPYPDRAGVENADSKRARVAREIFFERQAGGVLQQALPLAMLCLEKGTLRWLDVHLVRREVGAESTLAAGLGQRPRALLEAWLKQYQDHLDDVDTQTINAGFAAAKRFEALPPVGPLPASTLRFDTQLGQLTLLQSFFPPQVDCEFAFIPSDELAALVDEALALPPLDLRAGDDDLDHLSVLIVAPVNRQRLEALKRTLQSVTKSIKAAAAGLKSKQSPLETLIGLSQPTLAQPPTTLVNLTPAEQAKAWQEAIAETKSVLDAASGGRATYWYLRRRQLPYTAEISSATLRLAGNAELIDKEVTKRLTLDNALGNFNEMIARVPTLARAEAANLLAAPRLAVSDGAADKVLGTSDLLRRSAFTALAVKAKAQPLAHEDVLTVARQFGDPHLGEGFDGMHQAAEPEISAQLKTAEVVRAVAESGVAPDLDAAARRLPPAKQAEFATQIVKAATGGNAPRRLADLAGVKLG